MTKPVCVITGPTHGIGRVAALQLSAAGFDMALVCRNTSLGDKLAAVLPGEATVHQCDLGDFASVAGAADEIRKRYERVQVLVNNAGMIDLEGKRIGGWPAMMAVNHLGPFLFTRRLLDYVDDRIVIVASRAHKRASLSIEDPLCRESGAAGMGAYGQSKLANVLFTLALARRLKDAKTTVNALHPGVVGTNIMDNAGRWMKVVAPLVKRFMLTEEEGARTIVWLASAEDAERLSGAYVDEHQKVQAPSRLAQREDLQEALWLASEEALASFL